MIAITQEQYARLKAAEDTCFALQDWITYRSLRSMDDVYADWKARDSAKAALTEWAKLARAQANGGPG